MLPPQERTWKQYGASHSQLLRQEPDTSVPWMDGNVLFNDTLNTFYSRLYGVRHMVKDHSDSHLYAHVCMYYHEGNLGYQHIIQDF